MGIKKAIKNILVRFSFGMTDVLYRRPYIDREDRKRLHLKDELLSLDLVITECCSLKCRDCSNLMQYYQTPCNLTSESVISDLRKVLDCVRVRELKILGGEPFVNRKTLIDVLQFLTGEYKTRVDSVNIITNGTLIPDDECINAMKNDPKIKITISNYGELSRKMNELMELLDRNGIKYVLNDGSKLWLDFGRPVKYEMNDLFVKHQYKYCYNRKYCNTLYRGGLYSCPRQAHGIHLGLIPDNRDEYVDLYDPAYRSSDDLKQAIMSVVRRKDPVAACDYCIVGEYIYVPRGVQK